MTFEDIMNYSLDNRDVFESIAKNFSSIIPFVGSGLSAFAYPTWRKFLENVFEKLEWEEKRKSFIKSLDDYKYEEAASFLKEQRGILPFNSDIKKTFEKNIENDAMLHRQAVYLLPMLFHGLVLTTNFEKVLETVYGIHNISFDKHAIGHPGHPEMLNMALREPNRPTLYKFHGDISEVETNLILTKESYDLHYTPDKPLVTELRNCFRQKIMFFLGCSLNADRTMQVLDSTLEAGIENYAILPCDKSKIREKTRDLGNRRIRCIFYPENRHECVRIILERLLEINDRASYNRLLHCESNINKTDENRFVYDSGSVGFFGREKEIEKLQKFCLSEGGVKWWAITGEGGSGKSKLAYEFKKNYLDQISWESPSLYEYGLSALENASKGLKKNTLFIIDYVQANAKDIGKWLEALAAQQRAIKIRIILIERNGTNMENASWIEQIKSGPNTSYRHIMSSCYNREFLFLKELSMETIKSIMRDYAKNRNKILSGKDASSLYDNLKKIDPELMRPLYSLFLVDAWLENKQPLHWNREEILDYIVEREIKRYKTSLKEVYGSTNNRLENAFQEIKTMATMVWELCIEDEDKTLCKDAWNDVEELSRQCFRSSRDMLVKAGLAIQSNGNYIISQIQPDLVGEYFVLCRFLEDKQNVKRYISSAWEKPLQSFVFFSRLFNDYYDILKNDHMLIKMLLFPVKVLEPVLFAMFLIDITGILEKDDLQLAITSLAHLAQLYPDNPDVMTLYAKGLVNLSNKQDADNAAITVSKLADLVHTCPDNAKVVVEFAKGLVNLSAVQEADSAAITVSTLAKLAHLCPDNAKVAALFASGLFNLSDKQDADSASITISKLADLAHLFPDNPDVLLLFAKGLVNLSNKQNADGATATVSKLAVLAHTRPHNPDVLQLFASGLFNLSNKQDADSSTITVSKLANLAHNYPHNLNVLLLFANGLFNLSNKQDTDSATITVSKLADLAHNYPHDPNVVVLFAKGLVNLSNKQDADSASITISKLADLAHNYPDDPNIVAEFAKGLFNLLIKQGADGTAITISKLADLAHNYPDNPEVQTIWQLRCKKQKI